MKRFFKCSTMLTICFIKILILYLAPVIGLIQQMCTTPENDICHACQPFNHSDSIKFCQNITKNVHQINFYGTKNVNYDSYKNSNVKIIVEPEKRTFYPCGINSSYITVNRNSYYPIQLNLNLSNVHLPITYSSIETYFQKCVEKYCFNKNNRFECLDPLVDSLDFTFNSVVTPKCIQNITFANISSPNLSEIRQNTFFLNAVNLIFLKLDLIDLKLFENNVFQHLRHLKTIEVVYLYTESELIVNNSIFRYNPDLILITVPDRRIWNMCKKYYYVVKTMKKNVTECMISNFTHIVISQIYPLLFICIILITPIVFYFRNDES